MKRRELLLIKENIFFKRPDETIRNKRQQCDELNEKLINILNGMVQSARHRLQVADTGLQALNPYRVLERGYSIVRDKEGHLITDGEQINSGDLLEVMGAKGSFEARKI